MNREAVALGVPAYTTFAGRLGAVDEMLVHDGQARSPHIRGRVPLAETRRVDAATSERDPALLLDLMLTAL